MNPRGTLIGLFLVALAIAPRLRAPNSPPRKRHNPRRGSNPNRTCKT